MKKGILILTVMYAGLHTLAQEVLRIESDFSAGIYNVEPVESGYLFCGSYKGSTSFGSVDTYATDKRQQYIALADQQLKIKWVKQIDKVPEDMKQVNGNFHLLQESKGDDKAILLKRLVLDGNGNVLNEKTELVQQWSGQMGLNFSLTARILDESKTFIVAQWASENDCWGRKEQPSDFKGGNLTPLILNDIKISKNKNAFAGIVTAILNEGQLGEYELIQGGIDNFTAVSPSDVFVTDSVIYLSFKGAFKIWTDQFSHSTPETMGDNLMRFYENHEILVKINQDGKIISWYPYAENNTAEIKLGLSKERIFISGQYNGHEKEEYGLPSVQIQGINAPSSKINPNDNMPAEQVFLTSCDHNFKNPQLFTFGGQTPTGVSQLSISNDKVILNADIMGMVVVGDQEIKFSDSYGLRDALILTFSSSDITSEVKVETFEYPGTQSIYKITNPQGGFLYYGNTSGEIQVAGTKFKSKSVHNYSNAFIVKK